MSSSLSIQKLKRLRCSACPYRSNFRSDVGRHIRHKHRDVETVPITVMSAVEAAATLQDYMDMWTHRKITPSSYVKPDVKDPETDGVEKRTSWLERGVGDRQRVRLWLMRVSSSSKERTRICHGNAPHASSLTPPSRWLSSTGSGSTAHRSVSFEKTIRIVITVIYCDYLF